MYLSINPYVVSVFASCNVKLSYYVYKLIFLVNRPLYHYGMTFFISDNILYSEIYFDINIPAPDFFFFLILFIYLFMAVLGLRFCARAFSSCGKRGPLFITVCGPLTIAASLVAEYRLQTRRLSNCGSRA